MLDIGSRYCSAAVSIPFVMLDIGSRHCSAAMSIPFVMLDIGSRHCSAAVSIPFVMLDIGSRYCFAAARIPFVMPRRPIRASSSSIGSCSSFMPLETAPRAPRFATGAPTFFTALEISSIPSMVSDCRPVCSNPFDASSS